jgi:RNA polymerase sigma factor (TIGR02999 family)
MRLLDLLALVPYLGSGYYRSLLSDATQILNAIEQGDPQAAEQLLPLVYEELRKLAAQRLAQEAPGQTLQPTALVHEAYLRLVGEGQPRWASRGHFFAAAAEAMRRILVDQARRRAAQKRGGTARRVAWDDQFAVSDRPDEDLLALDEALGELEQHDPQAAGLVKLRYFSGLSHQQAAQALGVSRRVADRFWAVAKAWLYQRLHQG